MQYVIKHWAIENKVAAFLTNMLGVRIMTFPVNSFKWSRDTAVKIHCSP